MLFGIANDAHEHATFFGNMFTNLLHGFEMNIRFNIFSGRLTQLLCFFILGMQLGRQRLFYNENDHRWTWCFILCVSTYLVMSYSLVDLSELEPWFSSIYNFSIMMMIVSAIVYAWYTFKGVRRVLQKFSIMGRMSLTNYLLQSIIGSFIFCGYGLGCYKYLGTTYAVMIGCGIIACQYFFARYWFTHHTRGPLESVWRKLTWI